MTEHDDPVRLLDDAGTSPRLRALLVEARRAGLDAPAIGRIEARVQLLRATKVRRWPWWGVGGGVAVLALWLSGRAADERVAIAGPPAALVWTDAPRDTAERPVQPVTAAAVAAPRQQALAEIASAERPRGQGTRPRRPSRPAIAATTTRSEEAQLLLAARRKLGAAPADALALAETHRRRFPEGELAPERELVAVRALVALERRDAAETRGREFATRFPDSVHLAAMRRALAPAPDAVVEH